MGKKVADGLIAGLVRIKCNAGLQSLITEGGDCWGETTVKKEANHEGMTDDDAPQEAGGSCQIPKQQKCGRRRYDSCGHGRTWQDMAVFLL